MSESEKACPNCGARLTDEECQECGWRPITKEEAREAIYGYLDERCKGGVMPDEVSTEEIVRDLDLETLPTHIITGLRRRYKEEKKLAIAQQHLQQVAPNPPVAGVTIPTIPDWVLAPYRMQIETLKEELKSQREAAREELRQHRESYSQMVRESREKIAQLEQQLRDEIKRPNAPNEKWAELDKLAFDQLKKNIERGASGGGGQRGWVEELVTGLVQSGQLGNIVTEGAGLLADLRNRNNPNHDPYADYYSQQQAQRPQRRPPQTINIPPANIKRAVRRQVPVQQQAQPQVSQPPKEEVVPEASQEQQNPPESPQHINDEIYAQFREKYPDLADTVPKILEAIDEEQPGVRRSDKIRLVMETLRVVAQLREIGVGVKGLLKGVYTPEQAATYLIQRHPEQARVLAEQGADAWLERGARLFADHPIHGKDIKFLQCAEAKEGIDKIIAVLRQRFRIG